ncbi:MAG: NAD(P)H-dependent oxidoreductase [Firmicutes bacterium]|nr:NAD(P)H-dependent oxidoreductase [Bacillota bacterium]
MQLTIFNGSPRGTGSNSDLLIQWLVEGVRQNSNFRIDMLYLNKNRNHDSYIDKFKTSDIVLVVFPLYTDCMPGITMSFMEKLQPLRRSLTGLKLGFVVHSGFPEAIQSRQVEKYLEWLTEELGTDYLGTVVMGGSEGISKRNQVLIRKKRMLFNELGRRLSQADKFDAELVKKIAGIEKLGKFSVCLLQIIIKTGLLNIIMNRRFKEKNAYRERFARPYAE